MSINVCQAEEVSAKDADEIVKVIHKFTDNLSTNSISVIENIHPSSVHSMRLILERKLKWIESQVKAFPETIGMPSNRDGISDVEYITMVLKYAFEKAPKDFEVQNRASIRIRGMIKDDEGVYVVYSLPSAENGFTEPATISMRKIDGKWKVNSIILTKTIEEIWKLVANK